MSHDPLTWVLVFLVIAAVTYVGVALYADYLREQQHQRMIAHQQEDENCEGL